MTVNEVRPARKQFTGYLRKNKMAANRIANASNVRERRVHQPTTQVAFNGTNKGPTSNSKKLRSVGFLLMRKD
jgi:hypothetical protein